MLNLLKHNNECLPHSGQFVDVLNMIGNYHTESIISQSHIVEEPVVLLIFTL